jgi:hypothetical protein
MKHSALFIIGLSIMLFSHGCDSGPSKSGGAGFYPKIDLVQIVNNNDPSNPIVWGTFTTGDNVCFNMQAQDMDQNMKTLWFSVYLVDTETLYSGPDAIALSKQNEETMVYKQIGSIQLTEPAGEYRFDFQVEDETGNKSTVFTTALIVE